jgi:NADH:ubiquinone reductase (H+-translocating)
MQASAQTSESLPQVIIVGGGFGGLSAAKELAGKGVRVTLIDRTNHHLFQPLLYQVATAGLSPADIAQPIRHILRDAKNIEVMLGEVDGIDCDEKQVRTTDNVSYPYDYLILAAGARHSYFSHDEWEAFAPGLKSLEDAIELRRRILSAFEAAELATSKEDRQAALTFIIVGAGPTGVEMAGAIAELAHKTLSEDFRRIDSRSARILLLDGALRVLPSFSEDLSRSALAQLKRMEVEVHTGAIVKEVGGGRAAQSTAANWVPQRKNIHRIFNSKTGVQKMKKRKLGKSDLEVSEVGLGCMGLSFGYQAGRRGLAQATQDRCHRPVLSTSCRSERAHRRRSGSGEGTHPGR